MKNVKIYLLLSLALMGLFFLVSFSSDAKEAEPTVVSTHHMAQLASRIHASPSFQSAIHATDLEKAKVHIAALTQAFSEDFQKLNPQQLEAVFVSVTALVNQNNTSTPSNSCINTCEVMLASGFISYLEYITCLVECMLPVPIE